MLSSSKGSNQQKTDFIVFSVKLEAINLTLLNDEEIFTSLSFLKYEIILVKSDSLQSINKFEFLEFIQLV